MTCTTCRRGNDTDGDGNCPVCAKYARLKPSKIITAIRAALGPHLVKSNYLKFRPVDATPSWGCCYIASEALYHLWGKANGYTAMRLPYGLGRGNGMLTGGMHWFLEQRASGLQVDITADQFRGVPLDYKSATPTGFLTKKPSKRAQRIIDAVLEKISI
jgi:hypothetical protein